jgi:hypothetical protein
MEREPILTPVSAETDVIEKGYSLLLERIKKTQEITQDLSDKVKTNETALLSRMAEKTAPLISKVGLSLLRRGKQDTKGEIYNPEYYREKMIVLGKTTPTAYRPDNPSMPVVDQFCVLSEKGEFFELMYSTDGFLTDSYRNPISAEDVLQIYGEEPLFMLFHAMKDYSESHEELIKALQMVLDFILPEKKSEQ